MTKKAVESLPEYLADAPDDFCRMMIYFGIDGVRFRDFFAWLDGGTHLLVNATSFTGHTSPPAAFGKDKRSYLVSSKAVQGMGYNNYKTDPITCTGIKTDYRFTKRAYYKKSMYEDTFILIYVDDDNNAWEKTVEVVYEPLENTDELHCKSEKKSKWKKAEKYPDVDPFILNDDLDLLWKMCAENKHAARYWQSKGSEKMYLFFVCPQIEILEKAGYTRLTEQIFSPWFTRSKSNVQAFNRLTGRGTSPKTIFKTPKCVYETLKNERDLSVWDAFRRANKTNRLQSVEEVRQAYSMNLRRTEFDQLYSILNCEHDGKAVFSSLSQLLRYMNKIDAYEAISLGEGLPLLSDYLRCCRQLKIKPNLSSDSLKREHDVAARTLRNMKNEGLNEKMKKACEPLRKYTYSEHNYFIRPVSDYNDLIDEATQQRNCVAAFGEAICRGERYIFLMREAKDPAKSFVTVELSSDMRHIMECKQAYNRPVRNKSVQMFLKRFVAYIDECRRISA